MMDYSQLKGPQKAAIMIRSLGKAAADRMLSSLSDDERTVVYRQLDQMGTVSADITERVVKEFTDIAARRMQKSAMALPARSGNTHHTQEEEGNPQDEIEGLEAIAALSADEISDLIKDEHPQTIAIILLHLKTTIASDVIANLPDDIKTDVSMRVVTLEKVNADIVEEVNEVFKEILKNKKRSVTNLCGGVDRLAEILNQTDEISSELILSEIEETDAEMAEQIKQKMFVFEDLVLVDDRGFQKLLRKIETVELATALKAAPDEVKDKVFRNMSERAGAMLEEEIEDLGPVRMTEVANAQQAITSIIQEMEVKGEIIISGRRGEEIIT
ncbi:MAG: flagellar motor switch protein FliG [Desulfobacterales bacterium]|jgi:flagellar motor switch protein FliG